MNKNIGIIGGDLRLVNLAEILYLEGYNIFTYALEQAKFENKIIKAETLGNLVEDSEVIIGPIPFSKDNININTSFSHKVIKTLDLFSIMKNKTFIAGAIDEEKYNKGKQNKIIDILKDEELAILNSIPTAEGAIQIAMEKSQTTVHNSNCLILGFGRIGKILAKMLKGIGAKVDCEARKKEDLAWIKAYGYEPIELERIDKYLQKYDFIFNTVPSLIMNESRLNKLRTNCIIIDLASLPGGTDFEKAKEKGIKVCLELGLPGRVTPKTAAENIKNVLEKYI